MAHSSPLPRTNSARRVIAAAMVGNALEFYDLFIYGFLALTIAKVFFPTQSEFVSLLITVGTFGASYIMCPLGAVVLGGYADSRGRKAGMMLTIWSMGVGTALIAFAPSYAVIGLVAPMLVITGKLFQGFSAGGEFGTSVAFVTEHAPANRRGFYASFQVVGIGLATALAAGAGVLLNAGLPGDQIIASGWRLPFLFGLVVVPFGYLIRSGVNETPVFMAAAPTAVRPIATVLASAKAKIVFAIGVYSMAASTNYLLAVYIPTYAQRELKLSANVSFWGAMVFAVIQTFMPPLIGALSDRYGRLRFITGGILMVGLGTYPAFNWMINHPEPIVYLTAISLLAVSVIVFQGAIPAFLAELFQGQTRTTSLALVHNLNFALFGGMAPFICTLLIQKTGSKYVPAFYVLATVALALGSLIYFRLQLRSRASATFPVAMDLVGGDAN